MSYNDPAPEADVWSNWLFNARFAHNDEHERVVRLELERIADRVLDGATLESSMSLADVGTGDGLVGFRGIERTGASLKVHFVDVSSAALHHTRQEAIRRNIDSQCSFHEHSAEALTGVSTGSMDAVTTRAVLAYVADKPLAFREFFRILKPGGRISIAEPILRDDALELAALKQLVASLPSGSSERILPFLYRWKSAQLPNTAATIAMSPLTNFGERDLLRFAIEAGFSDIHMELHVDVGPSLVTSWDVLLGSSPHPWAPTLRVILSEHFSSAERQEFEKLFRPLVESRQFLTFNRFAYLTGRRPSSDSNRNTQSGLGSLII